LVCGVAICALCSQKYGGEGIFRCSDHPTSEKHSKKDEVKKSLSSVTQSMSQKSKSSSSRRLLKSTFMDEDSRRLLKSTFMDEDEKKKVDEKKKPSVKGELNSRQQWIAGHVLCPT
jgi:transcriptional regulator CtsR